MDIVNRRITIQPADTTYVANNVLYDFGAEGMYGHRLRIFSAHHAKSKEVVVIKDIWVGTRPREDDSRTAIVDELTRNEQIHSGDVPFFAMNDHGRIGSSSHCTCAIPDSSFRNHVHYCIASNTLGHPLHHVHDLTSKS